MPLLLVFRDDPQGFGPGTSEDEQDYTNAELYSFFAPGNDALPYVYESFDWEHCN